MTKKDTKQRILEAAAFLIHCKGFASTTIDDVLQAANVKKGNLYYYFSSKEELGLAVLDYFHEGHIAGERAVLENPDLAPLERLNQWLLRIAGRVADSQCQRGCPFGNLALELSDTNEAFRVKIADHFQEWQDLIASAVRAAQIAGEANPDISPDEFAGYAATLLQGSILMTKLTRQVRPIERAVADIRGRLAASSAELI